MARCIQLARNGEVGAPPNPMVGAVIVCNGRIIGEGYHARCGRGHAEVNAFASVTDESLLPQSTIYVSLEPCAHYGKTPPCAELIVRKGVRRVVVGCIDPFAKVQGRGIDIIRRAGIEVEVGVLERECIELNRRFFTFHTKLRPYITLKWAQTSDGVMGLSAVGKSAAPLVISTPVTMRRVHHLRATHSAILVGFRTTLADNPSLTTRHYDGPDPLRVVVDAEGQLPASLRVFDGSVPTLVFSRKPNASLDGRPNVEQVQLASGDNVPTQILAALHERNIQSLLVEGGSKTLRQFIDNNLWDEMHVEHSSLPAPPIAADSQPVLAPQLTLTPHSIEHLDAACIYHYINS